MSLDSPRGAVPTPQATPGAPPARRRAVHPDPVGLWAWLVVLVLAALAPLVMGTVLRINERAAAARDAAGRRALEASRTLAARVDTRARNVRLLTASLAQTVRTDAAGAASNDTLLLSVRRALPESVVTNLWVTDAAGNNIGTSFRPVPDRATVGAGDQPYLAELLRTRHPVVGDPVVARPDPSEWSVTFAHPVLDATGAVRGAVLGTLHLSSLEPTLHIDSLPPGTSVTALDSSGAVLARVPRVDALTGRNVMTPALRAAVTRPEAYAEYIAPDGSERIGAYAPVAAAGWRVFVSTPRPAALAEMNAEFRRDLLLVIAALSIAVGVTITLGRRIIRPIDALAADAKAIASGDYERRTRTDVPSEIASLATAFNDMAGTIAARTAALHRTEQRYRLLFDVCPVPLYLADLETHRVLAVNEAACEQYGYTRDEFLQLSLVDLHRAEDRVRFLAVARALAKAQRVHERAHAGAWRHVDRAGSIIDVEVFTVLTDVEGRPTRLSAALDVTARRRAEHALQESQDQLRRAQKMEALGRFAGGIAHDFNNLLTGILGYCDLALSDDALPAETREDFAAIREASQRAAGLTSRILGFSRGRVVQPIALDVRTVVEGMHPMLGRMIGEHIRLESVLPASLGTVLADPGQIEQVVMNLALNARDAMPDGGTLTITARDVYVDVEDPQHPGIAPGRWTVLEVRDTGIGMDADTQARIFEPFFTTKDRTHGTGLGLATVYGIVQQGGGAVRVWSAPSAGSRFVIYLPRVDAAAEARSDELAPLALPVPGGSETVLLVEDEDAVRAIACEALSRRGYRVLAAVDGPSALELARARAGEIDLLLTDVVMPGMNGRELAEALTRESPALRVLFMSGYTDDEVLLRGVSADAVALLGKPFTPDRLCARVRATLDASVPAPVLYAQAP